MLAKEGINSFITEMIDFNGNNLTCVRTDICVFEKLNFSLTDGQILFLHGPNGSGKSSLLRMMAGLLQPITGSMHWNGESISKSSDEFREEIIYVGHQNPVKRNLTVEENLLFWVKLIGEHREKESVDKALSIFELYHLRSTPSRFLSAGQTRRLYLARLVASKASVWLLDEPFNSLDQSSINVLQSIIDSHIKDGGAAIMATHDKISESRNYIDLKQFAPSSETP